MSQAADGTPHLRGHQQYLRGTRPEDQARNAAALREAIAAHVLADEDERRREQEEADAREREQVELASRRWLANEVSMSDEE
jgi:hypothetical protein